MDRDYISFLENQTPVKTAFRKNAVKKAEESVKQLSENKEEVVIEEGEAAAPNAEKEEEAKEMKPSGSSGTEASKENPKGEGEAAPTADSQDMVKTLTSPPEHDHMANKEFHWNGSGKYPTVFDDPLLKTIQDKISANPNDEGQKDPLREDSKNADKSPLSILEEGEDNLLEDTLSPLESNVLTRLITEMDSIIDEGDDFLDDSEEDLPTPSDYEDEDEDEDTIYDDDVDDDVI